MKSGACSIRSLTALAVAGLWLALVPVGLCAGSASRIFFNVGYRSGTAPLPDVSKLIESNRWTFVNPISGDDTTNLQAAPLCRREVSYFFCGKTSEWLARIFHKRKAATCSPSH